MKLQSKSVLKQSALFILLVLTAVSVRGENNTYKLMASPEKITDMLERKTIKPEQVPNPHWNKDGCSACHNGTPSKQNLKLKTNNVGKLCGNCHDKLSNESYFHPVNIKPSKSKYKRMSKAFKKALNDKKLGKGKVTCLTCHDVVKQCYTEKFKEKGDNHEFFRNGPYTSRSGLCFNCHNKKKYKRFNPHKQVSKSGKVYKKSCLMCHLNEKHLNNSNTSLDKYKFNVGDDWNKICTGCHPWKPHPGGELAFGKKVPNHLVVPSDFIQKTMKKMSKKKSVYLPVEPHTGKLYCGTCHNSHDSRVMTKRTKKKGANRKFRLRGKKMCDYCHDLY